MTSLEPSSYGVVVVPQSPTLLLTVLLQPGMMLLAYLVGRLTRRVLQRWHTTLSSSAATLTALLGLWGGLAVGAWVFTENYLWAPRLLVCALATAVTVIIITSFVAPGLQRDVDPVDARVAPEPLDLAGGEFARGRGGRLHGLLAAHGPAQNGQGLGVADGPRRRRPLGQALVHQGPHLLDQARVEDRPGARIDAGVEGGALGVAEGGVVVEADLAVQGDDAAVGGFDQGVDLHERGVLGGEDLPETLDDDDNVVGQGAGLEAGGLDDPVGDLRGDALERVDADAGQGLGPDGPRHEGQDLLALDERGAAGGGDGLHGGDPGNDLDLDLDAPRHQVAQVREGREHRCVADGGERDPLPVLV